MDKLDFYKHHIENPLIDIINTRAQDNNFERQWIALHVPNRDLQYAISQLSTLNLKLLQLIGAMAPATEAQLVEALNSNLGVISKNVNKLTRLSFISKTATTTGQAAYQLSRTGAKVVEVQTQLSDLLDKQHAELVANYTPDQLSLIAQFLSDLDAGH